MWQSSRKILPVVLMAGAVLADDPFTTITPCPGAPSSVRHPLITVTEQYQSVATCDPSSICLKGTCKTHYPYVTYAYVNTTIPAAGNGTSMGSTIVTSTDQLITISRDISTSTSYLPVGTGTGTASGIWSNGTTPTPSPIYQTIARNFVMPYNSIGPFAIPGYGGSDLCDDCKVKKDGSRQQAVNVTECHSGDGIAAPFCMNYAETWTSTSAPSKTSAATAAVSAHTVAPSAGPYTFGSSQVAPAQTMSSGSHTWTIPASTYGMAVTTSADEAGQTLDFTTTITKYITFTVPANTMAPTSSQRVPFPSGGNTFPGVPGFGSSNSGSSSGSGGWEDWQSSMNQNSGSSAGSAPGNAGGAAPGMNAGSAPGNNAGATSGNNGGSQGWEDWQSSGYPNSGSNAGINGGSGPGGNGVGPGNNGGSGPGGNGGSDDSQGWQDWSSNGGNDAGPTNMGPSGSSDSPTGWQDWNSSNGPAPTSGPWSSGSGTMTGSGTWTSGSGSWTSGSGTMTGSGTWTSGSGTMTGSGTWTSSTGSGTYTSGSWTTTSSTGSNTGSSTGSPTGTSTTYPTGNSTTYPTTYPTSPTSGTSTDQPTNTSGTTSTSPTDTTTSTSPTGTTDTTTSTSPTGTTDTTTSASPTGTTDTTTSTSPTGTTDTTTSTSPTATTGPTTSSGPTSTTSTTGTSSTSGTVTAPTTGPTTSYFNIALTTYQSKYRKRTALYIGFSGDDGVAVDISQAAYFHIEDGYLMVGDEYVGVDVSEGYQVWEKYPSPPANAQGWTRNPDGSVSFGIAQDGFCLASDGTVFIEINDQPPFACQQEALSAQPVSTTTTSSSTTPPTTTTSSTSTSATLDPSGDLDNEPTSSAVARRRGLRYRAQHQQR